MSELNSKKRLSMLFDGGNYTEIDRFLKNNNNECEVVAGYGEVNGVLTYAYAQSIDVMGGAMGKVQAAKIAHVYELAEKTGSPVVSVFDSNGAHVDEGVEALEAYGTLIKAAGNISGLVPQISVVAGPCIGSAAVLATLADVVVVTKNAELYITGSDCKDTCSAEFAIKNATAALMTETDEEAMGMVSEILAYLPENNLSEPLMTEYLPAVADSDALSYAIDANSFLELWAGNGNCIKCGFARIGGISVGVVASNSEDNEGYFCSCGAKKAARFVRLCDAFSVPVVTLVDSLGIRLTDKCGASGDVKAVSILTSAYSEATTPKITVVTGKAIAGAYIAFVSKAANPDFVFAYENSVIGAIEPMTAVQLLYKERMALGESRAELEKEYAEKECSPYKAAALGFVNDVITAEEMSAKLISALDVLSSKRVSTLSKKHTNIPF